MHRRTYCGVLLITDELKVLQAPLGFVGEEQTRRSSADVDDLQWPRRTLRVRRDIVVRVRRRVYQRHVFYLDVLSLIFLILPHLFACLLSSKTGVFSKGTDTPKRKEKTLSTYRTSSQTDTHTNHRLENQLCGREMAPTSEFRDPFRNMSCRPAMRCPR